MKKGISILLSFVIAVSALAVSITGYAAAKPASTSITKITSKSTSIKVIWKKGGKISGYQLQYANDSKFKKGKKSITVSKKDTTSKTISKLKSNKKYYVRIRTYKKSGDKKIYSSWSTHKAIATKRKSSSSNSSSAKTGSTVYITPTGSKYHYSKDCAGKNAIKKNLSEVKGSYNPCKKCAG